jgi:hypothetical protein
VHIRPTWLPFFPWTTLRDVADVFEFVADHDLAAATDPVQMSIRLLVPRGSLLEEHPAIVPHLRGYDLFALSWVWDFADPEVGFLQKELEGAAAAASDCGRAAMDTLEEMRETVAQATGRPLAALEAAFTVPRLTESWFCCAEPTRTQSVTILGRN